MSSTRQFSQSQSVRFSEGDFGHRSNMDSENEDGNLAKRDNFDSDNDILSSDEEEVPSLDKRMLEQSSGNQLTREHCNSPDMFSNDEDDEHGEDVAKNGQNGNGNPSSSSIQSDGSSLRRESASLTESTGTTDSQRATSSTPKPGTSAGRNKTKAKGAGDVLVREDPFKFMAPMFLFKGGVKDKDGLVNLSYKCLLCGPSKPKAIKCSRSSKSNLKTHVARMHPEHMKSYLELLVGGNASKKLRKSTKEVPVSVADFFKTKRPASQQEVDQMIVEVVLTSGVAFSFVENEAFIKLVERLQPGRTVMSRHCLVQRMTRMKLSMKEAIKTTLASVSFVCITTDAWTDAKRSYLGFTCHYINDALQRVSLAIACRRIKGTQDYEALATCIYGILKEFHILAKCVAVVTDNGSNFCKSFDTYSIRPSKKKGSLATQLMMEDPESDSEAENNQSSSSRLVDTNSTSTDANNVEPEQDLMEDEDEEEDDVEYHSVFDALAQNEGHDDLADVLPPHVRCAAHSLNLVASKDSKVALENPSYKRIQRSTMAKLQALWNKQRRSNKFADQVKDTFGIYLTIPCATRWNSEFDGVARVHRMIQDKPEGFNPLLAKVHTLPFSTDEKLFIQEFAQLMKPVAKALDIIQNEKSACLGYLLPTILLLRKKLQAKRDSLKLCKPLATAVLKGIRDRFSSQLSDRQAITAAIYVPRFKLRWLANIDYDDNYEEMAKKYLEDEMEQVTLPRPQPTQTHEPPTSQQEDVAVGIEDDEDFFTDIPDGTDTAAMEMERYLSSANSKLESLHEYPRVEAVYKKMNAALPSSAAAERLFSSGKHIFKKNRHRLSDDHFESNLLLNVNAKWMNAAAPTNSN